MSYFKVKTHFSNIGRAKTAGPAARVPHALTLWIFLLLSATASMVSRGDCHAANWETLNRKAGLISSRELYPEGMITAIEVLPDAVWIGTQKGLARYDGMTWKIFRGDEKVPIDSKTLMLLKGNVPEISSNRINDLLYSGGELWVATDMGLLRYTPGVDRWKRFDTTNSGICGDMVQLVCSFDKKIVIGTWGRGLSVYNPEKDLFSTDIGPDFGGRYVTALAGGDNRIFVGTLGKGLWIYNLHANTWDRIDQGSGLLPSTKIWDAEYGDHLFYVGTSEGLVVFDTRTSGTHLYTTVNSNIIGNNVRAVHWDPDSSAAFIATTNGISVFDGSYWTSHTVGEGLPGPWITAVTVNGNEVWAGTYFEGLARLKKHRP